MKGKSVDLATDAKYSDLVEKVKQSVTDVASESGGPLETLEVLKAARTKAKKENIERTKELKAYRKRVARLQKRASKLTDDGLLVEFARRQAEKERKKQLNSKP